MGDNRYGGGNGFHSSEAGEEQCTGVCIVTRSNRPTGWRARSWRGDQATHQLEGAEQSSRGITWPNWASFRFGNKQPEPLQIETNDDNVVDGEWRYVDNRQGETIKIK